jgi:transposase
LPRYEALEGRDDEHALVVGQILAHIDFLDDAIARLSTDIEQQIRPVARERDLLMTIPAVRQRAAEVLIAEVRRHDRVPDCQAPRILGRRMPRQTTSQRHMPQRPHRQGQLAHAADWRAGPRPLA